MKQDINDKLYQAQKHTFHIVSPSPWPFLTSVSLLNLAIYTVLMFHEFKTSKIYLLISFAYFLSVIGMWFRDVVMESNQGMHTLKVQRNFRYGMLVVLASETMFFFGFFWCYFYMSLSPSIWMGCRWPPEGMVAINPLELPLLNTMILVSSGVSAVFSHKSIMSKDGSWGVTVGLVFTMFLGVCFTAIQFYEYNHALFSMNDGIYGSIFYVSTGFHGLHVMMGTIAMVVCLISHINYHFLRDHHIGLELSFWYWHFVDVIWILLYIVMYWGGCNFDEVFKKN